VLSHDGPAHNGIIKMPTKLVTTRATTATHAEDMATIDEYLQTWKLSPVL